MLLNAVRGNGLASKINSAQATGPSVIHVLAYLSLTLVFTQPALLLFSKNIYATQVADAIKFDHNLRLRNFDELRAEGARQLKRDALIYSEKIIQLGAQPLRSPGDASPPLAPTTSSTQPLSPSTSTKKALVIGNQHYPTSPLRAPIKDANDIAQALRSAGYQVSLVTDGSRLILEQRINQYTQSLNAFDTSVFFYSGHGYHFVRFGYTYQRTYFFCKLLGYHRRKIMQHCLKMIMPIYPRQPMNQGHGIKKVSGIYTTIQHKNRCIY